MNNRKQYTIIPKYIKNINNLDKRANIKIINLKLKCEESHSILGWEI